MAVAGVMGRVPAGRRTEQAGVGLPANPRPFGLERPRKKCPAVARMWTYRATRTFIREVQAG